MSEAARFNIAAALPECAARSPDRAAIVFPSGSGARSLTCRELDALADRYAHALAVAGIERGDRVLVLVRPGPELVAIVFALLKSGAVPVLADPGLAKRDFAACVRDAAPRALVGIPLGHLLAALFRSAFASARIRVCVGGPWPGAARLERLADDVPHRPFPVADTGVDDEAAVAFTSGSTGVPKGVVYRHGNFRAQVAAMRDSLGIRPGGAHLACVHIFALFDPTLECTTVVPRMDPRHAARVDGAGLAAAIRAHGVTFGVGSPTIWRRLAEHCERSGETLPGLEQIFMFGAPVPPVLVERATRFAPGATVSTPYGATEGLPLTRIDGDEILAETAASTASGAGNCVGRPLPGVELAITAITDAPIDAWDPSLALPAGGIGEVVVRGAMVTREYLNRPALTAAAKIPDAGGAWHRMGDVGYLDEAGRLWFCGRKSHRVETADGLLLPVPCEAIFNAHPAVARTALVGVGPAGAQEPVLIVEPRPGAVGRGSADRERLFEALRALGAAHRHTRDIRTMLVHHGFPMDVRHNAKIRREVLAEWAARRLR